MLQQAALAEVEAMEVEKSLRNLQPPKQPAPPKYSYSIRPQSRKKLVSEPADFQKLGMAIAKNMEQGRRLPPDYHPPLYPEQYPYMKLNNLQRKQPPRGDAVKSIARYHSESEVKTRLVPKTAYEKQVEAYAAKLPSIEYGKIRPQKGMDRLGHSQVMPNSDGALSLSPEMIARFSNQLPHGVLRNGVSDGVGLQQLPARQQGVANFAETSNAVGVAEQLGEFSKVLPHFTRIAPASQVDLGTNSILNPFGGATGDMPPLLGQIPGIHQVPPQTNGPNPFEALLSNGNTIEQLGKLAKSLLMSEDGGQNNLLAAGLKALQRQGAGGLEGDLLGAAKTETRAAPTMMERLMASAAQAINESKKQQKELPNLFPVINITTTEKPVDADIEKSVALLKQVPEEQKKILEAAIRSGELDYSSVEAAIRSLVREDSASQSKTEKTTRLMEWIQKNRPAKTELVLTSDRLPYYGKYCGTFAEQLSPNRKYKPGGAVWAVDNQHIIVSKFIFQPESLSENITFWAGPGDKGSDPVADMFPSANGFYLKPVPIDVAVFAVGEAQPIEAKIRQKVNASSTVFGATPVMPIGRKKRETITIDSRPTGITNKTGQPVHLIVQGAVIQVENPDDKNQQILANTTELMSINPTSSSVFSAPFHIQQPDEDPVPNPMYPVALEWHAGFQPLLLTLPAHKSMKTTHWISLWDHKNQKSISSVVFPNGPAFQVPEVITLRSLFPNAGLLANVTSGPIRLIDAKTIEIDELRIPAIDAPIWFVVGKDVFPSANGHIVPIYNKRTNTFDCDSLQEYTGQTVTLKLPGTMYMKDVFWFSIFSLTTGVSYSHIYLPYNDMHLPPDLSAIPTPRCTWKD
ncbi:unnamed protein product, partial [Mesorhabditis spiculigera]